MQHILHTKFWAVAQQTRGSGLAVRTGLRGGVCVDVTDQVKDTLQALTDALPGTTTAVSPSLTSAPATTSR